MNTTIIKMTDALDAQPFKDNIKSLRIIDCTDIEGTRCYCDDTARAEISSRIASISPEGLHFIDSGNYHYLSLLWLEKITTDFALVLFDHHPDNQPPSFGDILSCGGWVLVSQESLPHLKAVYSFGVGDEIPVDNIPNDLPIYISIDKDVLSQDYAITDWDQGDMSLDEMVEILQKLFIGRTIIGVDICGDSHEFAADAADVNSRTNGFLFDFFSTNL